MTRVTVVCPECGSKARRDLAWAAGCRGVHETPPELAVCPKCHRPMSKQVSCSKQAGKVLA